MLQIFILQKHFIHCTNFCYGFRHQVFCSGKSSSKFGKKVFMAGNKVSDRDSSFVKYKFQFHLIFFNSLNTENVVWFIHLMFKHSKFTKSKTRQLSGNNSINSEKNLMLHGAAQSYFAFTKKLKSQQNE